MNEYLPFGSLDSSKTVTNLTPHVKHVFLFVRCEECPDRGAECVNDRIIGQPGFWRKDPTHTELYKCAGVGMCEGEVDRFRRALDGRVDVLQVGACYTRCCRMHHDRES